MDHGIYFNHPRLYGDSINVPLIVSYPKRYSSMKVDDFVQPIDIVLTILDLIYIQQNDKTDGLSLIP